MSEQPIQPRLLSKGQLAAYTGYGNLKSITSLINAGILPPPLPGTKKWDRRAVDASLDKASGLNRDDQELA